MIFEGNEVIPDADLAEIAVTFIGRFVAAEDLEELRRQLTLKYIDAGYINSGAILPNQEVVDGNVKYLLIEGELSKIVVTGAERLNSRYIEDRINLSTGPPLNIPDLQRRLRILLDDPFIERLDAELVPGDRPGESVLNVKVEEVSPVNFRFAYGNSRNPAIGSNEFTTVVNLENFFGWGEILSNRVDVTKGFRKYRGDISVPITAWDTRAGFHFEASDSETVEKPFNDGEIESKVQSFEFYLDQPIYRDVGQEYSIRLSLERRRRQTYLFNRRFSFTEGPDEGESVVSVVRLGQQWIDRDQDQVFAARALITRGFDVLGATSNKGSTPDGEFTSFLGQLQYVRRLTDWDMQVILRAEGQYSPDRLLSLEKFEVGGVDSVRGYRENFFVRDNGIVASAEFRIPFVNAPLSWLSSPSHKGAIEFAPFIDWGRSWNNKVDDPGPEAIAGVGAGLRWKPTDNTTARIYFAKRLKDVDDPPDRDLQDDGIYFRISTSFP